jgi:hypothetical protein
MVELPMNPEMDQHAQVDLLVLRRAIEASWGADTSFEEVTEDGNPALGQCYPTSRVIQYFYPQTDIAEGEVWTGKSSEKHFWNVLVHDGVLEHIDFTWKQFPEGSYVQGYRIRYPLSLGDRAETVERCERLLGRVMTVLDLRGDNPSGLPNSRPG